MRADAATLEAGRMENMTIETYPWLHERHRAFPDVFEGRNHRRVIDLSAGIGVVAKRITENYDCEMVCNEIDPSCVAQLKSLNAEVLSLDLDTGKPLPLEDESFDAVISLVTLEHIIHTEELIEEFRRIMRPDGRLYFSVPNYASIYYMIPLLKGRAFHDPLDAVDRYEFYAHVRYFTYQTVIDLFKSFDLHLDTVYVTLPKGSSKYLKLKEKSRLKAFLFRNSAKLMYSLSPRWHAGPLMCFAKTPLGRKPVIQKI